MLNMLKIAFVGAALFSLIAGASFASASGQKIHATIKSECDTSVPGCNKCQPNACGGTWTYLYETYLRTCVDWDGQPPGHCMWTKKFRYERWIESNPNNAIAICFDERCAEATDPQTECLDAYHVEQ